MTPIEPTPVSVKTSLARKEKLRAEVRRIKKEKSVIVRDLDKAKAAGRGAKENIHVKYRNELSKVSKKKSKIKSAMDSPDADRDRLNEELKQVEQEEIGLQKASQEAKREADKHADERVLATKNREKELNTKLAQTENQLKEAIAEEAHGNVL